MERKKHIRNLDRIRQMSVEELAPLLVHESYEFDVDYDWENPIETYDAVYNSPSGDVFNNYDDALDDCIQWLNEEPKNDGNDSLNISSPPPGVDGVSGSPHTSSHLRPMDNQTVRGRTAYSNPSTTASLAAVFRPLVTW